jgi:hypothetical protein
MFRIEYGQLKKKLTLHRQNTLVLKISEEVENCFVQHLVSFTLQVSIRSRGTDSILKIVNKI